MKTLLFVFIVACYSLSMHAGMIEQQLDDYREATKCVRAKVMTGVPRADIRIVGNTCEIK